ncbi:MAG TPA: permease prefix domain 1-containing protein [Planctomycetota bacterium]|nr:permease prefix domain 1-containing protein [Planctomycetota bacterium]
MSRASDLLRRFGAPFDPRSAREIREEIEAELAFHLESRERELVANGMTPEAAHDEARRVFGDVDKIRAECRRVRIGGARMLQRMTLAVVAVLIAVIILLCLHSVDAQRASRSEISALQAQLAQLTGSIQKESRETRRPSSAEDDRAELERQLRRYMANQLKLSGTLRIDDEVLSYPSEK